MEDRLAPQRPDAGLVQNALIALDACSLALSIDDLRHAATLDAVGAVHVGYGLQQPFAFLFRHAREHTAIGRDRLEQLDRVAESLACQRVGSGGHETSVLQP